MIKQAYSDVALARSGVCRWQQAFLEDREEVADGKSKVKLIVFFDIKGIGHHEFVPPGQTVNVKFYVELLKKLKRRVNRVRQDIAAD